MIRMLVHCCVVLAWVGTCDDAPRAAPVVDAAIAPPPAPPPREGCERSGSIESIESDPRCVVKQGNDEAMRAALRSLAITLVPEPQEVMTGGTSLLALTIKNTSSAETTVFLEARTRPIGPRTDWSRVVGIPEPHAAGSEALRLFFPLTTMDSYDHDVDALPTVAGSAALAPGPTPLAVHLRPGAKLTHKISWWALRIPAPAPIVHDDAGHRYVPKTAALMLTPGEYTVVVDLPFFGLSREERKVTARLKVIRQTLLDGGVRKSPF